jgi:DNA-binding NtrC family response regulator
VGLVLWIDQNTFATALLEKVFKKKNLPFYTLESAKDFLYLVEDLGPSVIVLDTKTAAEAMEAFKTQYESSPKLQALPFILLDESNELSLIKNVSGHIKRPFDPFEIPEIIKKILNAN